MREKNKLGKSLYNLQRFQILQTKLNPQTSNLIPNHYAYAWYAGVYPFLDTEEIHEDLKEYFLVSEEQVDKITAYADKEWLNKKLYNFYEYEQYFNVRYGNDDNIDRSALISVFRYMFLKGGFDEEFWSKLLEPMKHPIEASMITSDFDPDHIYLI